MQYQKVQNTYIIRIDRGEEIVATLLSLVKRENIRLAKVEAIGATDNCVVGAYDVNVKKFTTHSYAEQLEMLSLIGSVTEKDGAPYIHLHAVFARLDGSTIGGHVNSAVVSATCEMFLTTFDGTQERRFDDNIGINLLEF